MKPGDMIEWVDRSSGNVIRHNEEIWSTPMKQWVPVGGIAFLISITEDTYMWLSDKGLFHARVDDIQKARVSMAQAGVVPRVRG